MRRDRLTFGMIARHADHAAPALRLRHQHRPQAPADHGPAPRSRPRGAQPARGLTQLRLFRSRGRGRQRGRDRAGDRRGRALFVVTIPEDFSRELLRGERALVLVEADASDPLAVEHGRQRPQPARHHGLAPRPRRRPGATGGAAGAARDQAAPALQPGGDHRLQHRPRPAGRHPHHDHGADDRPCRHPRAGARDHGEPAGHAGPPVRGDDRQDPALHAGRLRSRWPWSWPPPPSSSACRCWAPSGSWPAPSSLYIVANLTVGFTFSTLARNQLQAMQMTFFFFLPSILLSGFMFPFRGMPAWAQVDRRGPAADPLPAHRARHHAERGRARPRSGPTSGRCCCSCWRRGRSRWCGIGGRWIEGVR